MKFKELNLEKELIENLNSLGLENLTQIQEKSLEHSLKGKDLIARAKTGSGKTLSFCIPLIQNLNKNRFRVQSLILAPTRELANQIASNLREYIRFIPNIKVLTLCGGVPFKPQVASLYHEAHIIVGTTGRVLKHIKEGNLKLEEVNTFILDEADKMLDMGFYDDIMDIDKLLPKNRQTLLFSATYEENIKNLSNSITKDAFFVEVENEEKNKILQVFYEVNRFEKNRQIEKIIKQYEAKSTIIFCNQKQTCEVLADELYKNGLDVLTMHSDLEQKDRDETLTLFSNQSYPILIASDVASRGIDIADVDLVINYDIALNEKIHTHRIGRTARAGNGGIAVTFYEENEYERVDLVKNIFDDIKFNDIKDIKQNSDYKIDSSFRTIFINGGKKDKLRKADILGSLTAGINLNKEDVGRIDIFTFCSYVAINKDKLNVVLEKLPNNRIKGKYYKIYEK
ncbi:ATP-dependent RNA helicase DbpA [Arcobacter porcinus]|uniref:ATP-dependent RNA helicase DbpA n=1 Tax=Arcobacter porcinus TaxID=1935204 RepID=A0A1C0AUN2_9BACT|nr:ATP-dependent RNA helicase DbpA [Arcobacter porcinus]OCL96627.1 ATP-dependent RNA helicase DbpA [Aliarcobacter thereius]OCL83665.1 ATP-dependent RNA helicase DbpA [Arcobacter porcinus]OCL83884.1 ATP-dependent RNA helicase DbpA [Arcobacter porcinus]OCL85848.1 ATP-dependent RNA helicase DbpA [Arcobacter porcinus]OCL89963.1 ATP-dependent RNA helicase DbpA [Arcobacter porcinus]